MTKKETIKAFKKYMQQYYDVDIFDYRTLNDDEIYKIYLEECENYGKNDFDNELKEYFL